MPCDNFQNGQAFLLNGGEQGRQLATLPGDQSYYINTELFTIEMVPRTHVPPGTVGLVIAKAGQVRPPDQSFGRHVPCDDFQDGQAFLDGGGAQGRQLAVLAGGTSYDINPELFEVITVDNVATADGLTTDHLEPIDIPLGTTGVVVTLDGAEPTRDTTGPVVGRRIDDHSSFRKPWVFLENGGQRGVQAQTLGEGAVYALNPWFVRVMLIPTRLLILEWMEKTAAESRQYDAELEPISVTVQGFKLRVEVKQSLQIPEAAAPALVSSFGTTKPHGASGVGGLVDDPTPYSGLSKRFSGPPSPATSARPPAPPPSASSCTSTPRSAPT